MRMSDCAACEDDDADEGGAVGAPLYHIPRREAAGENLQGLWLSGAPGLRMRICNPGLET